MISRLLNTKKAVPHMGQPFYLEFNRVSSTRLSLSLS